MASRRPRQLLIALGLVIDGEKVLLSRRKESEQPNLDGKWEIPGGKVEEGESVQDAAVREVLEETGHQVAPIAVLPVTVSYRIPMDGSVVDIILACVICRRRRSDPEAPLRRPDPKIAEVAWFPTADIPYATTLYGSREFIWHAARMLQLPVPTSIERQNKSFVEFRHINEAANSRKHYLLTLGIVPGQADPYVIARLWGRIGVTARYASESFETFPEAMRAFIAHASRRIQHGYFITGLDRESFPDKHWLEEHADSFHLDTLQQLSLFDT